MEYMDHPRVRECQFIKKCEGLNYYAPKTKLHIYDERNKIKIYHIGKSNDLPTKTILLIGETGAGKTTLVKSLYNHICGVNYDDKYRMEVSDEVGEERKEAYDSQTECITGYLFHYEPGMLYKYNLLIIDTPGMADTRGSSKQKEIVRQMEIFLIDEKFGIIDLHCLGFVVKASMNRRLEYFSDILQQCLRLFGKNTTAITQVMATHAVDKIKKAKELLESWGVSAERIFNFDNGVLYEPNTAEVPDSNGDILGADEISDHRRRWEKRTKEFDAFFQLLFRIPSESLRLTREALSEKAYLEQWKENLVSHIENAFRCILANQENMKMLQECESSIEENKSWKGRRLLMEKTRVPITKELWIERILSSQVTGPLRFLFDALFQAHIHNCQNCNQSCSDICYSRLLCDIFKFDCRVCNCPASDHSLEAEKIMEQLVEKEVTDMHMKEAFENAESRKVSLGKQMADLQQQESKHRSNIAKIISYVSFHTERLCEICAVPMRQSPIEFMQEIIEDLLAKNPLLFRNFDEDYKSVFIDSVLEESKRINIDKKAWKLELDKFLKLSNKQGHQTDC